MGNPAAVLTAPGTIIIEDRATPEPGRGQAQVRIGAVGICGSDVHYYEHGRIGRFVVDSPMIIGHEAAGVITAVGAGVDAERIGELVALEPGIPCRRCEQCRHGRYNLCPDVSFFATPPVDGAITGTLVLDADYCHPAPAGMSAEQAAMAEPVSVGVWASRKAGITAGDRVLVTGAGPIGLLTAQVARAFGAATVVVTDVSEYRLEVGRRLDLGTELAGDSASHDDAIEFDVLIECSGAPSALRDGMARLAPAARVVLVGMGSDTVEIDVALLQNRELTVTGTFRYANTYPVALELIAGGAVRLDDIVTHRFPLDRTADALSLARRDPHSLKAVVLP